MSENTIIPLWIDNEEVKTKETFPVTQASSNTTIHHASSASPTDATKAVSSSWAAFKTWRKSTHTERRDLILRVAQWFTDHTQELIDVQIAETSCSEQWAKFGVGLTITYFKEIAAQISSVTGVIPPIDKPATMGFVFKEPIGPVLCIAPWNGALVLAGRGIASAIAVGCTVVFKASELCPKTHGMITRAFSECGAPKGVLNQIQTTRENAAELTEKIIADPAIRKVEFIGSAAVGRAISQIAAKYLKPVLLELGGKGPAIILEDANLEEAAKQCALGAVMHHGQICFSTERIIVLSEAFDKFKDMLVNEMRTLTQHGVAGSAVSQSIAQHAADLINDATSHGADVLVGGVNGDSRKPSLKPTIVLNPPKEARIFDEETFGPSASLYTVNSDEEAVALANASEYGLNSTVWTRDMARFLKIARDMEYGQVHANSISVYTAATASQGGVKGSGFGRQNGKWGLDEFVVEKFVSWCDHKNEKR